VVWFGMRALARSVTGSTPSSGMKKPGDTVTASVTVSRLDEKRNFVGFETTCTVGGKVVVDGSALLWVPSKQAT
jgi:acyl dehydratase